MASEKYKSYWVDYYKKHEAPEEPSQFAQHVVDRYAQAGESLVELGCGNGRDARFFARNRLSVMAIDQCAQDDDVLAAAEANGNNPQYAVGDFTNLANLEQPVDQVYSRFTLHSVDDNGQARALAWSYRNLAEGGRLYIETRGQKNELYKKGEPVAGDPNAYIYDSHYRRFVNFDEFTSEIEANKFNILEASEETGFAPFEDTDYHFIRVIAEK